MDRVPDTEPLFLVPLAALQEPFRSFPQSPLMVFGAAFSPALPPLLSCSVQHQSSPRRKDRSQDQRGVHKDLVASEHKSRPKSPKGYQMKESAREHSEGR